MCGLGIHRIAQERINAAVVAVGSSLTFAHHRTVTGRRTPIGGEVLAAEEDRNLPPAQCGAHTRILLYRF